MGAEKYGAYNWRERNVSVSTYVAAAERHIRAYFERQNIDPESGHHHLGHAMACLAILIDADAFGCLVDDRPKVGVHEKIAGRAADRINPIIMTGPAKSTTEEYV